MEFFTGVTSVQSFLWIVNLVRHNIKKCSATLSKEDHILIVFINLRLGLLNNDIALRYGIQGTDMMVQLQI